MPAADEVMLYKAFQFSIQLPFQMEREYFFAIPEFIT